MKKSAYLSYVASKAVQLKKLFDIETALRFPDLGVKLELKFGV